jgi:acyl carrier protein
MNDHPTGTDFTSTVTEALCFVAPDLDGTPIDPDADLQDDFGLDSMDSLNLVAAIKERTGVDIPEREMPHLRTVSAIADYLASSHD